MPTPIQDAYQDANDTQLTSTGTTGSWALVNAPDPYTVVGVAHFRYNANASGDTGTVTIISCAQGTITISGVLDQTDVYIAGHMTAISGTLL